MEIQNDKELAYSFELLGQMYKQRESALVEPSWTPSGREAAAESVGATIRKIQREVYEYLKQKYEEEDAEVLAGTEQERELVA